MFFHDQKRKMHNVLIPFPVHFRTMMSDDAHKYQSTYFHNLLRINYLPFWHGFCYI